MNFNPGDFVLTNYSCKPGFVINKESTCSLISIDEYNGDYKWINNNRLQFINLLPEEELSIIANFGSWFYEMHKNLYQEILIKNIQI
jgi:hypothetical protein